MKEIKAKGTIAAMDIIICNAEIYTMDESMPTAQAVGIKNGIITHVGTDSEVLSLKEPMTTVINAGGRCLIPGLNDSHLHMLYHAINEDGVNLTSARSVDDVVNLVKAYIKDNNVPEGGLVLGLGWDQNLFSDQRFPTCRDLDKASETHFIYAARSCGHAAVVNSMTLEKYEINRDTKVWGGEILHFDDGEPNGVLTESAQGLLKYLSEPLSESQIRDLVESVAPNFAKNGITSVQTDDFSSRFPHTEVVNVYSKMSREGALPFRVTQKCLVKGELLCEDILAIPQPDADIRTKYRLGPIKLFTDGSLGARTAFMLEDYHDMPGNRGVLTLSREDLFGLVELVHTSGRDVAIHAIGDGAIEMSLDAIEAAQKKCPRSEARHGIVHVQITTAKLLKRFKDLNVFAYIQPIFLDADGPMVTLRVGAEKAATSYAFKTLFDSGVYVPLGTDCPIETINPFNNIYCAVARKGIPGGPHSSNEPFNPSEGLTVDDAVRAYTVHGAYASHEDNIKGRIKQGFLADLVILSDNIFAIEHDQIPSTQVVMTIFDGNVVYSNGDIPA